MPHSIRLVVFAALLLPGVGRAAFVAVYNSTEKSVTFAVGHPGKPAVSYTLVAGESRLVPTGKQPDIAVTAGGKPVRFRLEPYHAYMFSPGTGGADFHGIDLAGAMPRTDDIPADPPAAAPLKLPIALFADDANPRSRDGWEKLYRGRLAAASAVLEKQCGVRLEVGSVGDWKSDPTHADLFQQAKLFERVSAPAGALAVGFTSRYPKDAKGDHSSGFARGPLWPFVLVRDGLLRTEPEKVEAVVREVGHYLGAAHTRDPLSAMRGTVADGKGYAGRYPIGLDPLNLLAVGIWVDELKTGKPKSVADLKPVNRERLAVIYKTLAGILPTDELAAEHLASLERVGGEVAAAVPPPVKADPQPAPKAEVPAPKVEVPMPKVEVAPKPAAPPPELVSKPAAPRALDRSEAVRKVVQAVRLRAIDLKRDPDADKAKGDALTVELLMTAADIAYTLDGPQRAPAFLIGIGIALDDSDTLRELMTVGGLLKAVETDGERADRIAALGAPTLRGRRDLCQHFVVSAALTELYGQQRAESLGLIKEMMDRDRVSGFSFADLAADYAGVQLALALTKYPEAIGRFRDGVNLNDYMPAIDGLKEGLTAARFKEQYGDDPKDPRFVAALAAVKKRATDLPKYKEIAELKGK